MKLQTWCALLFTWLASFAHGETPPPTVSQLNQQAYMGTWYEIARLPNSFQKQCKGNTTAQYSLLENSDIRVINSCDEGDGDRSEGWAIAWLPDPTEQGKLKVSFVPLLKYLHILGGDYWVLDVDESTYSLVGSPDRKLLWILSRTPQMEAETISKLLKKAENLGYDTKRMVYTPQKWK